MDCITFRLTAALFLSSIAGVSAGPHAPLEIEAHRSEIWSIAFSPDGKQIASASKDRSIKLWDAATGAALASLEGSADKTAAVWDVRTAQPLRPIGHHLVAPEFHVRDVPDLNVNLGGRKRSTAK